MSLSDHFKTLPVGVQLSSLAVKGLQRQRKEFRREYDAARLTLEKEFLSKEQKLNIRRLGIITGTLKPKRIELSAGAEDIENEDEDYKPPPLNPSATSPIPDFWQTAICNHVQLGSLVTEKDIPALKFLVDVQFTFLSWTDPEPHFKLEFTFDANDFFRNGVLEKAYYYKESEYGGFEPESSVGTDIQWKRGKKLTSDVGDDGESSFFDFFTSPVPPEPSDNEDSNENEEKEGDEEEEEEYDSDEEQDDDDEPEDGSDGESGFGTYEEALEDDFAIGEAFKDELIPDAIELFMQEKEEGSSSDWESNDDDDDDENVDDEDNNDTDGDDNDSD